MKVLVIGGNKFFGYELVNQLIEKDFDVHVLNRGNHFPSYRGEITHHACDREEISEFKKIANLKWDIVYDQYCMNESHATTVRDLFVGNCKRYVMTSSQSVYDAGSGLSENDFEGTSYKFSDEILKSNSYAENKRRADSIILNSKELNPLVVRPPIVLGELDHTKRLHWHVKRISSGQEIYLPSLEAKISFVNAIDLAQNIVHLSISEVTGAVNICSREPISIGDLVSLVESSTGKKLVMGGPDNSETQSPYGIDEDWWMDTAKLISLGGKTREIRDWLPQLILKSIQDDKLSVTTSGF